MLPARQITPTDWMTDYKTVKIMQVIGGYEIPTQALFVGGCVRNTLLDIKVTDIDIATIHHPLTVIEKLEAVGVRYVPTGLEHGTVTAIIEDATFEITTLRKDMDTDGRHAVIAFTEKWVEDAQRRDFTINTLLSSPDGMIYDPTGLGLQHLDDRRIIFVGEPAQRIAEDYLRILRYFRFYALYGRGAPDPAAVAACHDQAKNLSQLSRERITQEFFKILMVRDPAQVLDLMFENDVLVELAEGFAASVMERLCDMQRRHDVVDPLSRLLIVSDMDIKTFEGWLLLSNAQTRTLESLVRAREMLNTITRKKMREVVYRHGNTVAVQAYMIYLAQEDEFPDLEVLDVARYWHAPEFSVTGHDLMEAGYTQGPELGKKLEALEEKWIKSDFKKIPKI